MIEIVADEIPHGIIVLEFGYSNQHLAVCHESEECVVSRYDFSEAHNLVKSFKFMIKE